ncbi:MAG TPA: DnaJ domain-containing protein [Candidatus Binatia bacterium]|jgi:preprotein translocase subunit Sec63|nr:DnaJ domain-containing protein [Candidatus Binatia bacterium]
MNEFSDTEIWLAVVLAFGAGYFLVSFLARLMKTEPPVSAGRMNPASSKPSYDPIALQEERCAQVLGIRSGATESEIEQAYQQLSAKYHPDKITELGDEFTHLASEKIKDIEEAYTILKRARSAK